MATATQFRRLALKLTDVIEGAHMNHPDFRANGRIFATLHGDNRYGMVKLNPRDQARFIEDLPVAFAPENGAWGRQGCTRVDLKAVDEETLGEALTLAWQESAKAKTKTVKKAKTRKKAR
jgi:hypothetical protein